MNVYQYRVMENDEDGDPLDHGVLTAHDDVEAQRVVFDRLRAIGFATACAGVPVRFYPIIHAKHGVWSHRRDFYDVVVIPADYEEEEE